MQTLQSKLIAQDKVQYCPLCGMPQEGFVNGIVVKGNELIVSEDKFYSFCNCNNIFFTDWSNMDQTVYNEDYQAKYAGPVVNKDVYKFAQSIIDQLPTKKGIFVEVGVVTDAILDKAKDKGFITLAMDINPTTKTKHELIVRNLDDACLIQAEVYWLSHVVEHLKDPIGVMKNIYNNLSVGGSVYVAMPDPWFIPWENPQLWAHWHHREHHIMWDMDSFIDKMISLGFSLHSATRRSLGCDYHIILTKES